MLVQQGALRSDAIDRQLACTLAGVAGALNASAFYSVGFFSANMTGNVSSLSDHLALGEWHSGLFYFTIVLAFILGAMLSTLSINIGRRRGARGIYALTILLEASLLVVLGGADLWIRGDFRIPVVVLGLSFLMGLQNAVVTRISDARVRTTHVSGMATDIGIELGMLIDIAFGLEPDVEAGPIRARLRLHAETILAFLVGGTIGVLLYRSLGGYLLWIAAAILALMAGAALARTRSSPGKDRFEETDLPNDL